MRNLQYSDDDVDLALLAVEQALGLRNPDGWAEWSYWYRLGEWPEVVS